MIIAIIRQYIMYIGVNCFKKSLTYNEDLGIIVNPLKHENNYTQ